MVQTDHKLGTKCYEREERKQEWEKMGENIKKGSKDGKEGEPAVEMRSKSVSVSFWIQLERANVTKGHCNNVTTLHC